MAITKDKKEEIVKDLKDKFSRMKSVIFVNYSGLGVNDMQEMRGELRKEDIDLKVAKKTLLERAMKEGGVTGDAGSLAGQIAVVFGYNDEIMPAKIIHKFTEKLEGLKYISGIIDKQLISAREIETLAKIPSRDELLAKAVGSMRSPMSGLVNVMLGNIRGLVRVLSAISSK